MIANFDQTNLQAFGFEIFHQAKCARFMTIMQALIKEGNAKLAADPDIHYAETSGWIISITRVVKNLEYFIPKPFFTTIIETLFPFLFEDSLGKENTLKGLAGMIDHMSFELKQKFFDIFLDYLHADSANEHFKDKRYHGYLPSFERSFLVGTLYKLSFQKNGAIDAMAITKIIKYLSLHTRIPVNSYLSYFTDQPELIEYFNRYAIIALATNNTKENVGLSYCKQVIDPIIDHAAKQDLNKHLDSDDIVNLIVEYGIR